MWEPLSPFVLSSQLSMSRQFLFSSLLICLLSVGCFLLSPYIGAQVVAFLLLLSLSVIALFFTILPVLWAALLSALIWDFFFLSPRYHFQVGNTEDVILLSMYFVIASVNAVLTYKIRRVEKIFRSKEEKVRSLALYDHLLNSLSHELRTPIATIIGAADNLMEEPSRLSAGDGKLLLSEIATASLRLNRQVENLLNMSRLESGFVRIKKDWCNISELVYQVVQLLEPSFSQRSVKINIPDELPLVRLDYGLMEQVLYNLIHNAILYTPEGTSVYILADCPDENMVIVVEDSGYGIMTADADKIFDKFYRPEHAPSGGSGLGLSIVKGFVEAHHGTVQLTNREGGGARFVIKIPVEKLYLN